MQDSVQISEFGKILLFLVLGVLFILAGYFSNFLLSKSKPNSLKNASYECGEEPSGNSWVQFNMRFYVIAIIFLLFDVEIVFLYPWATIYAQKEIISEIPIWGMLSLVEMFIFISILLLGLLYVWKKGDLNWFQKPTAILSINSSVPFELYTAINSINYKIAPVKFDEIKIVNSEPMAADAPTGVRRPPFRSAIKKTE